MSMKKAIIESGGKQYVVAEGQTLEIDLLKPDGDKLSFQPLLVIDGDNTTVGVPLIDKITVTAEIVEQEVKGEKVVAIRYKAKKRVHKVRGHRQRHTLVKISSIA